MLSTLERNLLFATKSKHKISRTLLARAVNAGELNSAVSSPQNLIKIPVRTFWSFNKFRQIYQDFWRPPPPKPPYSHICQIGDPILRAKAGQVKLEEIKSKDIQNVIKTMKKSMAGYKAVGLAAPQVGIPLRIITFNFSEDMLQTIDKQMIKTKEMEVIPFKVFINPELKVADTKKVKFPEACESVKGYSADVPRFYSVTLTGFDESGKKVEWNAKGWSARIIQHEMDHLDGRLYTDIMVKETFTFGYWHNVNIRSGRFNLSFSPFKIFS
ncbi:peptide deformylase, mitochondrial-like [Neocloeon triangulifer]|uniref:peptide deformylase, mitochondrial-like n=1 Tax=Neocloeon triangulifer TaxID=2078957 RepID=UPI00286F506E|nr:peptide deformylase, mitochondrial-like [Neocloeon triangulifer]XP_059474855.1 peptide deformylase, mitochondrial-like [Neocloeon triangulifer]